MITNNKIFYTIQLFLITIITICSLLFYKGYKKSHPGQNVKIDTVTNIVIKSHTDTIYKTVFVKKKTIKPISVIPVIDTTTKTQFYISNFNSKDSILDLSINTYGKEKSDSMSFKYNFKIPTIIKRDSIFITNNITKTIEIEKRKLFYGFNLTTQQKSINSIGPGILFNNKNKFILQTNINYNLQTKQLNPAVSIYLPF